MHAFDPTVTPEHVKGVFKKNHELMEVPERFQFKQLGVGATDGPVTFFESRNKNIKSKTAVSLKSLKLKYKDTGIQAVILRLKTIMCMLGHKWIDILKMDVEGVEMDICASPDFVDMQIPADQILIEFHERMLEDGNSRKMACIRNLRQKGYREVHASSNRQEIAFARMSSSGRILKPD